MLEIWYPCLTLKHFFYYTTSSGNFGFSCDRLFRSSISSIGGASFPARCNFFLRRTSHHSIPPAAIAHRKLTAIHTPVTQLGLLNRFNDHIVTAIYHQHDSVYPIQRNTRYRSIWKGDVQGWERTTICHILFCRNSITTHHINARLVTPSIYHPA
jgi:hypothetical protein